MCCSIARRGAEAGRGLGLSGGEQRGKDAVVDLGIEDRELEPVGSCYRPRYLNIQRLNYLWTIRHSSARIAGLIT